MALTAAQKKALADAQALKAKLEKQLAAAEKAQASAPKPAAPPATTIYLGGSKVPITNPSVESKKTATQTLADTRATTASARAELEASDPTYNKAAGPPTAPAGYRYTWIGGTNTGQWQLYKLENATIAAGAGAGGGGDVVPEATGPTLAFDTFKNTLALFFGATEVEKAWVSELYKLASPYYKTGSTVDDALNLALQEGRKNPNLKEFTARFSGIYKLQDKLISGIAVTVPTIAEYIASQAKMGEVAIAAGLGTIATQEFLADRIGDGLNVTEFTKRINDVYLRIDKLPQQAKSTINRYIPTVDRTQLAKALLTGTKGAQELAKEVSSYEVLAAAEQQGLGTLTTAGGVGLVGGVDLEQAGEFAALGYNFGTANQALSLVAQAAPTYEKLLEIDLGKDVTSGEATQMLIKSDITKLASAELAKARAIANEAARYSGKPGAASSKSFASQARGAGLI